MKTNPVFRASYPIPSGTSKKYKKEKAVQAIFANSQKKISSKKKLPKGRITIQKSDSINFSRLIKK